MDAQKAMALVEQLANMTLLCEHRAADKSYCGDVERINHRDPKGEDDAV